MERLTVTDDRTVTGAGASGHTAPTARTAPLHRTGDAGDDDSATAVDDRAVARRGKKGINRTVIEWVVLVVAAIGIALVIKTFLFQAFYIPSASMVPTLEVGDRVLVNKLSYDLHDVNRGDIVVFAAEPNRRVAARPASTTS